MSRLTKVLQDGPMKVMTLCQDFGRGIVWREWSVGKEEVVRDALDRLAAYEDTGLEPEQVAAEHAELIEARREIAECVEKHGHRNGWILLEECQKQCAALEAERDELKVKCDDIVHDRNLAELNYTCAAYSLDELRKWKSEAQDVARLAFDEIEGQRIQINSEWGSTDDPPTKEQGKLLDRLRELAGESEEK